jgi:hypothetical protein
VKQAGATMRSPSFYCALAILTDSQGVFARLSGIDSSRRSAVFFHVRLVGRQLPDRPVHRRPYAVQKLRQLGVYPQQMLVDYVRVYRRAD